MYGLTRTLSAGPIPNNILRPPAQYIYPELFFPLSPWLSSRSSQVLSHDTVHGLNCQKDILFNVVLPVTPLLDYIWMLYSIPMTF